REELTREGGELGASRTLGEDRARNRDMALEHAGEAVAHFGGRFADRDGAGNVRGAVLVLAAGIDQKQLARRNDAIALGRDAIMDDRAVGTGAGDGWKGNVLEQPGGAAKAFERRDGLRLGKLAAWGREFEHGEDV